MKYSISKMLETRLSSTIGILSLGAVALVATQVSHAAVITVDGEFSATNWTVYYGSPSAPIDPLYLKYSATFDDALVYNSDPGVITVLGTNIPYSFSFSFTPGNGLIMATLSDPDSCTHLEETFCAFVFDFVTGVPYFVEQSPAGGGGWKANTISGAIPEDVPEPSTGAMLLGGMSILGALSRRRRATAAGIR